MLSLAYARSMHAAWLRSEATGRPVFMARAIVSFRMMVLAEGLEDVRIPCSLPVVVVEQICLYAIGLVSAQISFLDFFLNICMIIWYLICVEKQSIIFLSIPAKGYVKECAGNCGAEQYILVADTMDQLPATEWFCEDCKMYFRHINSNLFYIEEYKLNH